LLYCSNPLIAYQLGDGILHCTDEAAHSAAVLARIGDEKPTMYIMRIPELRTELHCAFNFRSPKLGGTSNLKLAGDSEAIKKIIPSIVAEYKLRRILFDDRDLCEQFRQPGVGQLMELTEFIPGPAPSYGIARFEASAPPRASSPPVAPTPPTATTPRFGTTSSSTSGSHAWIWFLILAAIIFLLIKAC
jgi:hypothetical protein